MEANHGALNADDAVCVRAELVDAAVSNVL